MRIASNKITDIARFFRNELNGLYEKDELETLIAYCFEEFLGIKRNEIVLRSNDTVSESELLKFNFAVKDLKKNKPIQYILGKADFYGLKLLVNEDVLIPRPETEELVHLIVQENSALSISISILDIGTGSGCIPIALKKNLPEADLFAIDISEKVLEIARKNAELNNVDVKFIRYDILSESEAFPFKKKFDIIVSNPPYIRELEKEQMRKNVLDHEPHLALFVSNDNPLLFYNAIADMALKYLNSNGRIYFEINEALGAETKQLLENKGFKNVKIVKDINGKNRILRGNI